MIKKYFNVAGPCNPEDHYMIQSEKRCADVMSLIEQKQYFVIHAARQSGKTTLLLDLVRQLNDKRDYYALYCSLESVQSIDDPKEGIPAIIHLLESSIKYNNVIPFKRFVRETELHKYNVALRDSLIEYCSTLDKPLAILFDEADCLSNGTIISFLRQLRDGYVNRSTIPFVHSIGLIGMRNIRDYKGKIREERQTLGSASPFNIVTKALTLRNFTQDETASLYAQHTEATGQPFPSDVVDLIYRFTQGQPWLVNAVAREIVAEILNNDFTKPIQTDHVPQAVETIIQRRDTHIDSLLERLKEERVKKIIEPVITGQATGFDLTDDDYQYALDLGLIINVKGILKPSNPIYAEVMIRKLSSSAQMTMDSTQYPPLAPAYLEQGVLNIKKLLTDFQAFWRENSTIWQERFYYKEAAPHLILMAFLQRIINQGGSIARELATGGKRIDLCIDYQGKRYPIEIKIRYSPKTIEEGKKQLADYMDSLDCSEGWLVVFDQRKKQSWTKKLFWRTYQDMGKTIHAVGC